MIYERLTCQKCGWRSYDLHMVGSSAAEREFAAHTCKPPKEDEPTLGEQIIEAAVRLGWSHADEKPKEETDNGRSEV